MIFSLVVGILLGALSVLFVVQNTGVVTITFLDWQIVSSLPVVLFLAIIGGIVMTLLVLLPSVIRGDFYLSTIKKEKRQLEEELANTKKTLADVASRPIHVDAVIAEQA